jgi:hypothetical protein
MAEVEVLANGAIYVDGTRITDRSTKPWGGSPAIFSACIRKKNVVQTLVDNGFVNTVKRIDTEPYLKQVENRNRD